MAVTVITTAVIIEIIRGLSSPKTSKHIYNIKNCNGKLIANPLKTVTKLCFNAFLFNSLTLILSSKTHLKSTSNLDQNSATHRIQ